MSPASVRAAVLGAALGFTAIGFREVTGVSALVVFLIFAATVAVPVWFGLPLPGGAPDAGPHSDPDDPAKN